MRQILWKNVDFSTFWTSSSYRLERRFFVLQYDKRQFPGNYCLKRKLGKMATFGPKPWVNPFGKNVNISTFWTSCIYNLKRPVLNLEYSKRHFPGLYCLKKKKFEKWPFLDQNHGSWIFPLGKCQFFDFLNFLFL